MKTKQPFLTLAFLLTLSNCIARAETFYVKIPAVLKFNPISNQINFANYIGLQMYHPLFSFKNDGSFTSHFLDEQRTFATSKTFDEFRFCLKKKIQFNDGALIDISDFKSSFEMMAKMYPHIYPLKKLSISDADCLIAKMNRSTPNLFRQMTGISSTIIKKEDIYHDLPTGFGNFQIETISEKSLALKYSGQKKVRFDRIEFSTDTSSKTQFHDLNLFPIANSEQVDKKKFQELPVLIPKIYAFVINLPSLRSRKCVQTHLAKLDVKKSFCLDIKESSTFLPWLGKNHMSRLDMTAEPSCGEAFQILVPELFDANQIQNEIDRISISTFIKIKKVSNKDFGNTVLSGANYVGLIAFDSTSSVDAIQGDLSSYFESFFSAKNRIVSSINQRVKSSVEAARNPLVSAAERAQLYTKAASTLVEDGFIYPVGGLNKNLFFAKGIEITHWFDQINGVPDVAEIK